MMRARAMIYEFAPDNVMFVGKRAVERAVFINAEQCAAVMQ